MIAFKETPASIRSTITVEDLLYDEKIVTKNSHYFTYIIFLLKIIFIYIYSIVIPACFNESFISEEIPEQPFIITFFKLFSFLLFKKLRLVLEVR